MDIYTKALEGKANIRIYSNNTYYNAIAKEFYSKITEMESYLSSYPERDSIHETIGSEKLNLFENLFFEIDPVTDYTFAMRLSYKHDWHKIKLGTTNAFRVDRQNKRFYGYFHMHEIYQNILLTISLNRNFIATCYAKYKIYDKNEEKENKNSIEFEQVPNESDSDFNGSSLNLMNLVAIRLPKIQDEKSIQQNNTRKKLVKVLFSVAINDAANASENDKNKSVNESKDFSDIEIKIMATPEINNISKSDIPQKTIFYSPLSGFEKAENSSIQIYDLKRKNADDDTLVVEISSCKGSVDILMSKKMLYSIKDAEENNIIPSNIDNSKGRTVYKFSNIDSNNYYMMLIGRKIPQFDCYLGEKSPESQIKNVCSDLFSNVLVYYYTTKSTEDDKEIVVPRESIIYEVIGDAEIKLKWTPLFEISENYFSGKNLMPYEKYKLANVTYQVFISNSVKDYIYMDSVCYLNYMSSTNVKWEINDNDKEAKIYGMEANKKYFINILARKVDSDVIAYKAIEVILETSGYSIFTISKLIN